MRILIAGASGAIGRPLVRCLKENRQIVFALARSPQSSRAVAELGAEPVTADALDAASVKAAITQASPPLHSGGNEGCCRTRLQGPHRRKHEPPRGTPKCRRAPLPAAKLCLL